MKPTSYIYDKSFIMKNAWRHYRCCFNITFSEALHWAWEHAKEERRNTEYAARKHEEYQKQYGKQDRYLAKLYKDVVWGKNDYRVTYGHKYRY